LQLLKEVVPGLSRIAVLWNPANAYMFASVDMVHSAAGALGMQIFPLSVRTSDEFDAAFAAIARDRPGALVVLADRVFLHERKRIVDFGVANRLPVMSVHRELVDAGGLMSFGPSYAVMHRQAAGYVAKILRGARPADLPVEQPAKFEFVLNSKTAAALGLALSPLIQLRADEVIE
jgi:putative ABC transport system substrate-binding protein